MGNNHACKVVGLGRIQIKVHNGVVITLMDVSTFHIYAENSFKNGVLKVVCGSFSVKNNSS